MYSIANCDTDYEMHNAPIEYALLLATVRLIVLVCFVIVTFGLLPAIKYAVFDHQSKVYIAILSGIRDKTRIPLDIPSLVNVLLLFFPISLR